MKFRFLDILRFVTSPGPRYLLRLNLLSTTFQKFITKDSRYITEIGAGSGDVSDYLAVQMPNSTVTIFESSNLTYEILDTKFQTHSNVKTIKSDFNHKLLEKKQDLVLCFEVLEHINNDLEIMTQIYNSLSTGGVFILSVPAYMKKWQAQDVASGHVRRYEHLELVDKLNSAGFTVIETTDYGFPLTSIMRPFREIFYSKPSAETLEDKTAISGVGKRLFSTKLTSTIALLLLPFFILQRLFSKYRLGDGFIVVAKKEK